MNGYCEACGNTLCVCDTRTVGNVLARLYGSYPEAVANCKALGIDPDTPFEDFARWLRYGKNADGFTEDTPPGIQSEFAQGWFDGGNFVIRAIKALGS